VKSYAEGYSNGAATLSWAGDSHKSGRHGSARAGTRWLSSLNQSVPDRGEYRIIGFLQAHSVDYRIDTERTKFEPEQIAEEAKKFTVKVTCEMS
jgi:hypothetical protein